MSARQQLRAENAAYGQMMRRMLKAYGTRVGNMDVDELAGLADFAKDANRVLHETVTHLRTEEGGSASWSQIGRALGITRATAQQRFAAPGGARTVGGQPAHLR